MPIGDSSTGTVTIKAGGKFANSGSSTGIRVGNSSTATLNVQGGEVELTTGVLKFSNAAGNGAVNITDGGQIAVPQVTCGSGAGTGTLTIDGGTIKAMSDNVDIIPANSKLNVYAGDSGATIDANSKTVTISEDLQNKSGEAGVMHFTGGGNVTLAGAIGYTGGTTIEAGTTVLVDTAAKKEAILGHGFNTLKVMPAVGTFTLLTITGDDTFAVGDVAQTADDIVHRYAVEIVSLTARYYRRGELVHLRRREYEHDVRGGLFKRFQQGVERRGGEHMHLVYYIYAHFQLRRRIRQLLDHVAHLTHAVVARRVHLDYVERQAGVDRAARFALAAGIAVYGSVTVDGFREDLRARRLAGAAHAAEQIGVADAPALHLTAQDGGYGVSADDVRKDLRAVFPVQRLIHEHFPLKELHKVQNKTIHRNLERAAVRVDRIPSSEQAPLQHTEESS